MSSTSCPQPSVSAARHTADGPLLGVSATAHWRPRAAGPPLSRLSRTGEQPTQKPLAGPIGTPTPRPVSHSHLTKRPAVARATAGKVLAAGCAGRPGTDHPPRAILAVHEGDHLNHLVRRSSHLAELLLQLAKKVSPASFSTGLALGCVAGLRPQGTQG